MRKMHMQDLARRFVGVDHNDLWAHTMHCNRARPDAVRALKHLYRACAVVPTGTGQASSKSLKKRRSRFWRGRLLFTRQGTAERVLDWLLPALWILALLTTIISFW